MIATLTASEDRPCAAIDAKSGRLALVSLTGLYYTKTGRDEGGAVGRIVFLAAILAAVAGCSPEAPETGDADEAPQSEPGDQATPAETMDDTEAVTHGTAGDWVVLFNGENLDGWRGYQKSGPGDGWVVEDGAIVLDVPPDTTEMTAGDLITEKQYENFELELEWKISEGGNSGIFYGVREIPGQEVAYETGIEMQVLDDERHPDGRVPETSAGACYALYAPENKVLRPVGEYNSVRIVVDHGHVEHWLNGKKIVEYVIGSDDWNTRVAKSKFADWEHFAKYRKGYIGLQDHSDRVSYRNIRIRTL